MFLKFHYKQIYVLLLLNFEGKDSSTETVHLCDWNYSYTCRNSIRWRPKHSLRHHNNLYSITEQNQISFTKVDTKHRLKKQGYLVSLASLNSH